ncbi:MAG: hypothetical protein DRN33_01130 [Thermoplasmata archaeon]|nr:MAG: hypothetical protein FE043_02695 [Thermoplasmata archaeon]RLF64816.1 MAG: hypothetical protein DRN33_01130 [Thermoplasmata archaeon]
MDEESMNEDLKKWIEEHRDMGILEEVEAEEEEKKQEEVTGRCEICGVREAKYRCIKCGRAVCPSCYFVMFGLCRDCISEDVVKKLDKKDFGIDEIR